jgi:hypothetical protein
MPQNPYEPPQERPTPWTALTASTLGALVLLGTAPTLINHAWNPPAANVELLQVGAYFLAGIVWLVAGMFLFAGRWKTGWVLLLIGCVVVFRSFHDR